MSPGLHGFLFGVYPYICLTVFLLGSLIRFDRDQYTWKSDSSQLLRTGLLRWGSNLFHVGILFLFFGHLVGLLAPHAFYAHFLEASVKQKIAIYSGISLEALGHMLSRNCRLTLRTLCHPSADTLGQYRLHPS